MNKPIRKSPRPIRNAIPIYPTSFDEFQLPYVNAFTLTLAPEKLQEVFKYSEPARVFTNSMSDLFHESVPFPYVDMMIGVMDGSKQHQFQMLTKRANRMAEYFACRHVPDNVWLGVSVENRSQGIPRIAHLQSIKAKIRWLSIEPLLEDLGELNLDGIHWVVVGGESGDKNVRPMHIDWVRSIRDQCIKRNIAFFMKQWGSHDEFGVYHRYPSASGYLLDGEDWSEWPDLLGPSIP